MAAYYQEGTIKCRDQLLSDTELEEITDTLKKAMKGFFRTDEKKIIEVLSTYTNDELQRIKKNYKTSLGRDLVEDLKSELCGHFETLCVYRLVPSREFDAYCLRKALKGIGTDEIALIEILCSHNNEQIREIKEQYKKVYSRDLEEDIKEDTRGDFEMILVSLLQGNRSESQTVDQDQVKEDVDDLKKAGTKYLCTDESVFNKILAQRSMSHLQEVFKAYRSEEDQDLENVILAETNGDLFKAYISIVRYIKDPLKYFARCFRECLAGPGTDDERLMRLVITHCEVDLKGIEDTYMDEYKIGLSKAVHDDTSGDYRKLLLKLM